MSRIRIAVVLPVIVALATIGVSGCSGDPDPAEEPGGDTAVTAEPATPADDAASEPEGDGEAEEAGGTESEDGEGEATGEEGAACLVGDWVIGDDALGDWYRGFVGGEGIEIGAVTGEILLSMSASDYIYATEGVTVGMSISGQDATTLLTGGVAGVYTADPGGVMSTRIEESDFDARVTVSGIDFSAQEMGIDLRGAGAFVGYECDGDTLTLETQSAGPSTAFMTFEAAS